MKNSFLIIVIFIGVIFCAVGFSDADYRTSIGRRAPSLSISDGNKNMSLDDMRGEYVLLNFWKSTDAPSRQMANDYTYWLRRHPGNAVKYVSVNIDESPELFNEIVKLDNLIPATQFHVDGAAARAVSNEYGLDDGLGSMLIDPNGKIIAHNPSWEVLNKIKS